MKNSTLSKLAVLLFCCQISVLSHATKPAAGQPDIRSMSRNNGINVHEAYQQDASKKKIIIPGSHSPRIKTGGQAIKAFAWNAYSGHSGVGRGPVSITLPDGKMTNITEVIPDVMLMSAADFVKEKWIATSLEENSGLYEINIHTGYYQSLGRTGVGINALAYDAESDILYGAGADEMFSYLFTIDPENGITESVGMICEGTIIGLAADMDGRLYGLSLYNNALYEVDKTSGQGTLIGQTGLNLQYAQDIAYDRDNFILYGTLFTEDGQGGLYEIDTNTGQVTLLKDIGAELTAFAIPYTIPEEGSPAAADQLTLTADPNGAYETLLSWKNPSESNNGTALSELEHILIYRDNALIHTLEDTEPGAIQEYIDQEVPGKGVYHYKIAAVNAAGRGAFTRSSVYVGPDVPAAVNNLKVSAPDGEGVLSWEAPEQGLHGGFFSGENLTYEIVRYPDYKVLESSWHDCSYVDSAFPETGNYFYSVTASNEAGEGGTAVSNIALLGDNTLLFFEDFEGMEGPLPPGWEIRGKGMFNWRIMESSMAGGDIPEMCFYFLPLFEGVSRLVSPEIILYDHQHLILSLDTRMINFTYLFKNEKIGIDVSLDNGSSWQEIWGFLADTDFGPEEMQFQLKLPSDAEKLRIAFRFEGESGNIMEWSLDNVKLRKAKEFDLLAKAFRGNHFLVAGESNLHTITVLNQGYRDQDQYSVSLFNNLGNEIASTNGREIAFGEEAELNFEWTSESEGPDISSLYARVDPGENQPESISPELQVFSFPQGTGITHIGDAQMSMGKYDGIPFDFDKHESITQSIYFPEEMEVIGGQIQGLALYNHFLNEQTQPIQIYMGLTQQDQLSEGFISLDAQELVFSGDVHFPAGQHPVLIMLDEAFTYTGGEDHLVISFAGSYNETIYAPPSRFLNSFTPDRPDRSRTYAPSADDSVLSRIADNPALGDLYALVPNTTLIIDGSDMGSLRGEVLTTDDTSTEGTEIKINATGAITHAKSDGAYRFPRIPKGEQHISASKKGYYTATDTITILENEAATLDFSLQALPVIGLSGRVTVSDSPDFGIEGAIIRLSGYDQKETTTTPDGHFHISGVFGDESYCISVSYDGYDTHEEWFVLDKEDMDLGNIVLREKAHPPFNVKAVLQNEQAMVSWEKAGSAHMREFRYDSGIADKLLGEWPSDFNTVYGSVYPHHAMLEEISWQLRHAPDDLFPHEFVTLWVIGLDNEGKPDPEQIIYKKENVPNTNKKWCHHKLSQAIVMEEGFFIGISANDHIGIAIDTGTDAGYPFPENTHYVIGDITSGESFIPLETFFEGIMGNFFIRATGWDYGMISPGEKAFEHYRVFRLRKEQMQDDMANWTELNSGTNNLSLVDEGWSELPSGEWLYAIIAEYTNGVCSEASFSNLLAKDMHAPVSIQVSTNTDEPPTGAFLTLSHEDGDPVHIYSSAVPPNGMVTFPNIWKGHYRLEITLEGYQTFVAEGLPFDQDENNYQAQLKEDIQLPYNLIVDTRDLEQGQAAFSWNNAFIGELWEGFEGAFPPEGWLKLNPLGGDGWSVIQAGTSPIPGWEGGEAVPAPEGEEYMAIMTYILGGSTANDQWLITPALHVSEGDVLSFDARYWPNNFDDNLEILISTSTQNEREAFDIAVDKLKFTSASSTNWQQYTYQLTDYVTAGSDIYIAFREYVADNVDEGAVIMLDNVFVGPAASKQMAQNSLPAHPAANASGPHITSRAFQSYNVFLNDMEEAIASGINDTEYLFTELSQGTHYAGVQSVYTSGSSDIVSIEFNIEYKFSLSFNITDEDGNAISEAQITFDGEVLDAGEYQVQQLLPGTYTYRITYPGYATVEGEVHISDANLQLDIVMSPDNVGLPPVLSDGISVYPNPARNLLHMEAGSTIKNVKMFDLSGNLLLNQSFSGRQGSIDTSRLRPGIYLLRIMTEQTLSNTRVQIIR